MYSQTNIRTDKDNNKRTTLKELLKKHLQVFLQQQLRRRQHQSSQEVFVVVISQEDHKDSVTTIMLTLRASYASLKTLISSVCYIRLFVKNGVSVCFSGRQEAAKWSMTRKRTSFPCSSSSDSVTSLVLTYPFLVVLRCCVIKNNHFLFVFVVSSSSSSFLTPMRLSHTKV